ncbi:MAG: hypothetical protein ACREQ9_03605 [Candidatus Binatia bacterium]
MRISWLTSLRVALAVGAAISSPGCGRELVRPGAGDDLLPLIPGNYWIYDVRNPAGASSKLEARVSGEIESAGMRIAVVEESGGVPGEETFESNRDPIAYYTRGGFIFRSPWIPHPDRAGTPPGDGGAEPVLPVNPIGTPEWRGQYQLFDLGSRPMYRFRSESRLASIHDAVTVPAGRFDRCMRVETTLAATVSSAGGSKEIIHHFVDWYAPGVGLVRTVSFVDVGGAKREVLDARLVSFGRGGGWGNEKTRQ